MLENIWLAIIGAVGACLINTVLIWWFLKGWIHDECKAEGPDYIHGHYRGRLVFMSAVMMAVLLVFLVLDIAWFSRTGLMRDAVR